MHTYTHMKTKTTGNSITLEQTMWYK